MNKKRHIIIFNYSLIVKNQFFVFKQLFKDYL